MADQVLVDFRAGFEGLKADAATIKTEFKSVEDAGVKAGEKTTASFDKATESTKSLKSQLKDLKAQIAVATDPKEVERLSKAAGELSDKINDASESVKVFASGSKFQQLGNAFGSILSNVRSLDFQRANEQAKVFAGISKSITFKEGLTGLKDLGGTFLSLGKSLLLNPLFLIPTLITALVSNFDKLASSGGIVGTVFSAIGKTIGAVVEGIKDFANAIGLIDSEASDFYEKQKANIEAQEATQKKTSDRIIQILQAQKKDTFKIQQQSIQEELNLNEKKYQALRQAIINGVVSEEEGYKQIKELGEKKADLITQLSVVHSQETQKIIEDNKKLAKQAEDLAKVLRDLRTGNIANDFDRERQALADKLADDIEKYKKNGAIIAELRIKAANDLEKIAQKEREQSQSIDQEKLKATLQSVEARTKAEEQFDEDYSNRIDTNLNKYVDALNKGDEATKKSSKEREQAQKEIANQILNTIDSLNQLNKQQTDSQISEIENRKDYEINSLEDQFKKQLISKDEYEKQKADINNKAQAEEIKLKRKQFETDKQLSLIKATISGAEGVVNALKVSPPLGFVLAGLVAAQTALQIAVIANQQPPKFEKGGRVGGRRHSQGGTLIEAEEGEHVTRRDMAIKHDRMLSAINSNQMESFIKVHYIAPAIREYKNKQQSIVINTKSNTISNREVVDSLKESRRQSREDFNMLARIITSNSRSRHKW